MQFLIMLLLSLYCALPPGSARAALPQVPSSIRQRLDNGLSADTIVLFDAVQVRQDALAMRQEKGLPVDDAAIRQYKAGRYREIKARLFARDQAGALVRLRDYSHLPLALIRVPTPGLLEWLRRQPEVASLYEDQPLALHLAESLPLVRQPATAAAGFEGEGATVAVIDTGIDYTLAAFGACSSPGVPVGECRVVYSADIAAADGSLDDNGHGTNVGGIVSGVAPKAELVSLDVFDGSYSSDSLIIEAINWAIANQQASNIAALNLSLGNGIEYTSPCDDWQLNPYLIPVAEARAAGIVTVASAGNDGFVSGLARPACTPGVVSVGAVYDADLGGLAWSSCTDYTTAADQVTCFSNSADYLTLLAPGALIQAAGITKGGTSQAAPHVAGGVALLRAAMPEIDLGETVSRLTTTGIAVEDHRNGVVTPRLNLYDALGPHEVEDIPLLPGWGLAGLAGLLLGAAARRSGRNG